jgi:hypothetical protein
VLDARHVAGFLSRQLARMADQTGGAARRNRVRALVLLAQGFEPSAQRVAAEHRFGTPIPVPARIAARGQLFSRERLGPGLRTVLAVRAARGGPVPGLCARALQLGAAIDADRGFLAQAGQRFGPGENAPALRRIGVDPDDGRSRLERDLNRVPRAVRLGELLQ